MNVILTPVAAHDAAELIAGNIASAALHHPWTSPFTDEAGFSRWFAGAQDERNVSLIARARNGNGVVGVINFSEIVRGSFRSVYTGFYAMAGYAGRGLMTEALRSAVDYAFGPLDLHRVEANIQPGNTRSIALVQRVGFRKEGLSPNYLYIDGAWRDHERWAICAEDII